ncbi:AAA family ATPase [Cellulomonas hominis]
MGEGEIESLQRAVQAAADNVDVRMLLVRACGRAGRFEDAVQHAAMVLSRQPDHAEALAVIARAGRLPDPDVLAQMAVQLGDEPLGLQPEPAAAADPGPRSLDDVAGMAQVKRRLEKSFFAPVRHRELAAMYGVQAGGGLLLYGPPGCGKTFVARAVAAQLGAGFVTMSLAEVLSPWLGEAENNVVEVFAAARLRAPCVVFLDEADALGHRRSGLAGSAMRGAVNQLLMSLDGAGEHGVYTIAATNHPWDVDPALCRPGRLEEMVFVGPPDADARAAIVVRALRDVPCEDLDVARVAEATAGFSGADVAGACREATSTALMRAVDSGRVRALTTADVLAAASRVVPSTGPWFDTARTVLRFAARSGQYADLRDYMRKQQLA